MPCTSIVHHLSGPSISALARQRGGPTSLGLPCALFYRGSGNTRFPCALGFATRTLARMLDSLVRVSRRVGSIRRNGTILGARRLIKNAGRAGGRISSARGPPGEQSRASKGRWRAYWRGPGPSCLPRGARKAPRARAALIRLLPTISRTFHFLFKVLFIFPSRYLFAIGLERIFSIRRYAPPTLYCSPKQYDSRHQHCYRSQSEA